jgi:hypothetical protein
MLAVKARHASFTLKRTAVAAAEIDAGRSIE